MVFLAWDKDEHNGSILIYNKKASHSLQIWQRLNWIQYKPHKGGFTEENELLLHSETNRPSADSTSILCECWLSTSGLLQVVGDTTWVNKSTVSLAVPQRGRHIGNNLSAYSREIALWDTNCRLERQYKWFLHHVLTVNQRLTNLPSNRALNNVLNSSD